MQGSTAEQLKIIQEVFLGALEQPQSERHAWLNQRLAGHRELVPGVLRLLDAHVNGQGLELSACESDGMTDTDDRRGELQPGTQIGAWTIERMLARGGMSRVYLARRDVAGSFQQAALKLIATDADERRFNAERRILARLQHPAIAHLLDGGLDADGRPWLATEYVEGQPIDAYFSSHDIDLHKALRLLIELADALAHAHANLVVHRDIKPSNVLVTAEGHVKLLDFGIATLLEHDGDSATRTGTSVMTPRYAAPEQILGRPATTQTDVHALGVLAHELLSGCHPYGDKEMSVMAISHAIVNTPAPRPSTTCKLCTRHRRLRGDIDAVILKALRKDPTQRYASAASLSEDLQRVLRGEAVQARRGSRWYNLRRSMYRHRLALAVAAVLVLSIAAMLGMRLHQLGAERDRANAVAGFLGGLVTDLDPVKRNVDNAKILRIEDVLDAGRARLAKSSQLDPAVRARLYTQLASNYQSLGLWKKCEASARAALALPHQDDIPRVTRWDATSWLAVALGHQHRYDEAEPLFQALLHETRDIPARHGLASMYYGLMLNGSGHPREAIRQLESALDELEEHGDVSVRILALRYLAMAHNRLGEQEAALEFAKRAFDVTRTQLPNDRIRLARCEELYADYLVPTQPELAQQHMQHALGELRKLMGSNSEDVASTENNYGLLLWHLGRHEEAEAMLRQSIAHKSALAEFSMDDVAASWQNLAAMLCNIGEYQRCITAAIKARDMYDKTLPNTHYLRAFPRLTLSGAQLAMDQPEKARQSLLAARPFLAALPESSVARRMLDARLAMADAAMGHCRRALPRLRSIEADLDESDRVHYSKGFKRAYSQCRQSASKTTPLRRVSSAASMPPA